MSTIKRYQKEIGPGFNQVAPGSPAGSASEMSSFTVSLTAAQIIAMGTTPITIVPAPGTGKALIIESLFVEITRTSTQFTGGGVVHFYYHGLTVETMAQTIAAASITGTAGVDLFNLIPVQTAGGSVVTKEVGIDITNATAAFAAGTGTMKIFIRVRTVTL